MSRGGYSGGSTIIGSHSGWFSKRKTREEKKAEIAENRAHVRSPAFQALREKHAALDSAEKNLRKTVRQNAPVNPKRMAKIMRPKKKKKPKQQAVEPIEAVQAVVTEEILADVDHSEFRPTVTRARKSILSLKPSQK